MDVFVHRHRAVMAVLSLAVFACFSPLDLSASTVVVGTCKNLVQFTSIQSAINASPSGTTIDICPGVYAEQLSISKTLTLTGVSNGTADAAVVVPPRAGLASNTTSLATGNPIAAHVWVLGPATVNFNNLTVDSLGNGFSGCGGPDLVGILYQNASGVLNHIVTRNQWIGSSESDTGSNGCQTGLGIFVQSGNAGSSTVTVENSSVHDYQKNGITGNETGTTLTVNNNDVVGQGATNGAAENGVQIGFGAAGAVNGNLVIDDVWAPDTITDTGDAAAGILLYDVAENKGVAKNNLVGNTQFGIAVVTDTAGEGDGATVTGNKVFGTRIFDAIDLCSNSNVAESNTIMNSSESAIHLDASCGASRGGTSGDSNTVSTNTMIDACVGILEDSGTTNTVGTNTFFAAGATIGSSCTPVASHRAASKQFGSLPGYLANGHYQPARP